MRITNKAIMDRYNRGLNNSLHRWSNAQNQVLTQRNFNEIWENPAAANRSFQLREQFRSNATHLEMTKQTQSILDQATSSAMKIADIMVKDVNPDVLSAVNGTTSPADRATYAKSLRGIQKSLVLVANSKVGNRFLFGGQSTQEVPFELRDDGVLTYRGIDVNTKDPDELKKLEEMSKEQLFVDLGFGIKEANVGGNQQLVETSVFNISTPGLELFGYGTDDATGFSNNTVTLLGQMADALETEPFDQQKFSNMVEKYKGCVDQITDYEAALGTKAQFLNYNVSRLEENNDTLNARIIDVEQVDMPEAISNYIWQGYTYNASLKVGMDIVSQSLLDFMR